jgi:hypothetical protein
MKAITLIAMIAAAVTLASAPADAKDKGAKFCPPGLAKKSPACIPPGQAKKGNYSSDRDDRDHDRDRWHSDDDDRDHDRWRRGDRIDRDRYIVLQEGDRVTFEGREYLVVDTDNGTVLRRGDDWYRLPRYNDGSDYVRIGDSVVRVNRETREVIELIRLADLILG